MSNGESGPESYVLRHKWVDSVCTLKTLLRILGEIEIFLPKSPANRAISRVVPLFVGPLGVVAKCSADPKPKEQARLSVRAGDDWPDGLTRHFPRREQHEGELKVQEAEPKGCNWLGAARGPHHYQNEVHAHKTLALVRKHSIWRCISFWCVVV